VATTLHCQLASHKAHCSQASERPAQQPPRKALIGHPQLKWPSLNAKLRRAGQSKAGHVKRVLYPRSLRSTF